MTRRCKEPPRTAAKRSFRPIAVFRSTVPRLTRRQAMKLGAAAAALGALRPGRVAAAPRAQSFSLDLPSPAGAAAAGGGLAHDARLRRRRAAST